MGILTTPKSKKILPFLFAGAVFLTACGQDTEKSSDGDNTNSAKVIENEPITGDFCGEGQDETASNGVFCSDELGLKFEVPPAFAGKLEPAKVTSDSLNEDMELIEVDSLVGYNADLNARTVEGKENSRGNAFSVLNVAEFPKDAVGIDGWANGYYDVETEKVVNLFGSADTDEFQHVIIDGIKVYHDGFDGSGGGDTPIYGEAYLFEKNDKLYRVHFRAVTAPTVDAETSKLVQESVDFVGEDAENKLLQSLRIKS